MTESPYAAVLVETAVNHINILSHYVLTSDYSIKIFINKYTNKISYACMHAHTHRTR